MRSDLNKYLFRVDYLFMDVPVSGLDDVLLFMIQFNHHILITQLLWSNLSSMGSFMGSGRFMGSSLRLTLVKND